MRPACFCDGVAEGFHIGCPMIKPAAPALVGAAGFIVGPLSFRRIHPMP